MQHELPLTVGFSKKLPRFRPTSLCIYCQRPATTKEHVPPKTFLIKPYPSNYRTVPCCEPCNSSWSLDEEYARVFMGMVSFEPSIMAENTDGGYIDRILSSKPLLDDRINSALSTDEHGRVSITPEIHRIKPVFEKIASGLFALRYGVGSALDQFEAFIVQPTYAELPDAIRAPMFYWPGIRAKKWTSVQNMSFQFLFANGWLTEGPPAWCFMNFHNTIFAAVGCPPLVGKPSINRLKAKAW